MNIAVVGAGISGLTAAYHLARQHRVTVYEAEPSAGGHAHTVTVPDGDGELGLDTGFIVYNESTYPGFTGLLRELGVATQPGDMSFASRCDRCGIAFSSRGLAGFLANPRNARSPAHLRMVRDLFRFYRDARRELQSPGSHGPALGDYANEAGPSRALVRHFLVPIAAAIWSTPPSDVLSFPFTFFVRFLANHGLIGWGQNLQWRTVTGGSREYVRRIRAALPDGAIHTGCPVLAVRRDEGGATVTTPGGDVTCDAVVLACHADDALRLLADATDTEHEALGGFGYTRNRVVLHAGDALLPRRAAARASWNVATADCRAPSPRLTMTYDLNRLQSLVTDRQYCVSVNPGSELPPEAILGSWEYTHPSYTAGTLRAQELVAGIQGARRTWYAGAHLGNGFHEDGFQAGLRAARMIEAAG